MKLVQQLILKINNALVKQKGIFFIKKSKNCLTILNFLYCQGFILGYFETDKKIIVYLKNKKLGNSFSKIRFLKKKGLRYHFKYKDSKFLNNLKKDIVILSTSKGLLTLDEAFKLKIGGEFFFLIIY